MHMKSIACFNVTITAQNERYHVSDSWTNYKQKKMYLRKLWFASACYRISLIVWTWLSEVWTGNVYFNFCPVPFQLSDNVTMSCIISWLFSWCLTRYIPQKEESCFTLLKAVSEPRDKRAFNKFLKIILLPFSINKIIIINCNFSSSGEHPLIFL